MPARRLIRMHPALFQRAGLNFVLKLLALCLFGGDTIRMSTCMISRGGSFGTMLLPLRAPLLQSCRSSLLRRIHFYPR